MQMQFDIIKPITGSLPFSNTKHKGKEKLATKKKMNKKNIASANMNSHEVLKIE